MSFTWIPLYRAISRKVLEFENRQGELLALLRDFKERGLAMYELKDQLADGTPIELQAIDPFTFFAAFCRQLKEDNRRAILGAIKDAWNLQAPLPSDFSGMPSISPQNAWFFGYSPRRKPGDVPLLWRLARSVIGRKRGDFPQEILEEALQVYTCGLSKLTMGMYWINPHEYLAAARTNVDFANRAKIDPPKKTAASYFEWVERVVAHEKADIPTISLAAYVRSKEAEEEVSQREDEDETEPDLSEATEEQGIEFVRYFGPLLDALRSLGGAATAKAATAKVAEILQLQPEKLNERTKGKGGIPGELRFPKNVAFARFYLRDEGMIEPVTPQTRGIWKLTKLGRETRLDVAQAREMFLRQVRERPQSRAVRKSATVEEPEPSTPEAHPVALFTKTDALDGLFMDAARLDTILDRLMRKKALILQGPPGVGKTFVARRLAYTLMGERDDSRVCMVQFHPSYSYEDFVQGFRPDGTGLRLRNGVFHEFARRARHDPTRAWFFIIDEINRGNLAKVFGELLMLLEADKRGPAHAVPLTYAESVDETFWLPENLHVIGTMNTADRSLAMVDYALRRRFAFVALEPALARPEFRTWLADKGASSAFITRLVAGVERLNVEIDAERDLGSGFRIGHSFFCPPSALDGAAPPAWERWLSEIIDAEIAPLLDEYFEDRKRVGQLVAALREA